MGPAIVAHAKKGPLAIPPKTIRGWTDMNCMIFGSKSFPSKLWPIFAPPDARQRIGQGIPEAKPCPEGKVSWDCPTVVSVDITFFIIFQGG